MLKDWIEKNGSPFIIAEVSKAKKWNALDSNYNKSCSIICKYI